ncbi:hypothetical protein [Kitasatospora sp. NPDC059599]|uniref:hypothetical protein n=1 Tax=Kitasatospora sp. NPDC059599 TaxID=3346880 RepID=UPI003699ABB5
MSRSDTSAPGRRQRRGRASKDDPPWPRRPLLTALWIPAAAVLLPLGGALGAFGLWLLLPALVLVIAGATGLIYALLSLCRSGALRLASMALVIGPLVAVPLLAMNTAQATVLGMRGVTHPGTVTGIRVVHGKTTSYYCSVRYEDAPGHGSSVDCGTGDTVGERVIVTEDPGGLVDPEFGDASDGGRFDLSLLGLTDASLLGVAGAAAGLGALIHLVRTRAARRPPWPPQPPNPVAR